MTLNLLMISKVILRPILKWLIAVLTIFRNIRLSRCRILVDAKFVKIGILLQQPRSRDTKDCCIRKCSCKSCWKSILAVKSLIFLYVGKKLARKSLVCRFRNTTNYANIMKSRDTNERGRRKPKMMKINAIRKRKRFLPKKRVSKTFFKRKQINVK